MTSEQYTALSLAET